MEKIVALDQQIFALTQDHNEWRIYSLQSSSGHVMWETKFEANATAITMVKKDGALYVLLSNLLLRVDSADGSILFRHQLQGGGGILVMNMQIYCLSNVDLRLRVEILDFKGELKWIIERQAKMEV